MTEVFLRLGLDTGKRIKSGDMKIDIPTLEEMFRTTEHPILKALIKYKRMFKMSNSYLEPLYKIAKGDQGFARFAYQTCNVPTGRLSAGKDGKNSYFSPVNVQSIPKPKAKMWYVREATEEEIANKKDILGYSFSLTEKSDKWIEGFDPYMNIRTAFTADEGHYWLSLDMEGEELRIAANVFKEPVWINAFKNGEDIHKNTTISIWGHGYTKDRRKKAKVANFGVMYGMEAYSFAKGTIDLEEAKSL